MKFCLLLFILIFRFNYLFAIDTKAEQAIVIDFLNNEVLFEKNSNQKIAPASMTKIMTVYAAFDRLKNIFNCSSLDTLLIKDLRNR